MVELHAVNVRVVGSIPTPGERIQTRFAERKNYDEKRDNRFILGYLMVAII